MIGNKTTGPQISPDGVGTHQTGQEGLGGSPYRVGGFREASRSFWVRLPVCRSDAAPQMALRGNCGDWTKPGG